MVIAGSAYTVIETAAVTALGEMPLFRVTTIPFSVKASVGVPEITPVAGLSESPGGRDPEVTLKPVGPGSGKPVAVYVKKLG